VVSSADAVIAVPLGVAVDRRHLADLHVVLLGAAVALLTDVIAYSLQAEALTKISGRLFSILTSTKPAAGAALGLIFLDQRITAWQWAGIAADAVAAVGAARGSRQSSTTAVMTVAQSRRELTQLHASPSLHCVFRPPSPAARVHVLVLVLPTACDRLFTQSAGLPAELAAWHGISSIQQVGMPPNWSSP